MQRSFDLWSMLPKHNRRADVTGDLRRWISCLQVIVDELLADIDRFTDIFDLERAPESFLDLILKDLGNPFRFQLDTQDKRRLATILSKMYQQKGTEIGIKNAIRFFLGIEIVFINAHHISTLVLGESELGVDWILGPSNSYYLYAFDIVTNQKLTPRETSLIRDIVEFMKPAHTHLLNIIDSTVPIELDIWEVGRSELSISTILSH